MGTVLNIKDRIKNDFTYHTPPKERVEDFVKLRAKALELAELITDLVPNGREQASALTRLEESIFHANAGIARQYPAGPKKIYVGRPVPYHISGGQSGYVEYGTKEDGTDKAALSIPDQEFMMGTEKVFVLDFLIKKFGTNIEIVNV